MSKVSAVRPGFVHAVHATAGGTLQGEEDGAQRRDRRPSAAPEDRVILSEEALNGATEEERLMSYAPPKGEHEVDDDAVDTALDLWLAAS